MLNSFLHYSSLPLPYPSFNILTTFVCSISFFYHPFITLICSIILFILRFHSLFTACPLKVILSPYFIIIVFICIHILFILLHSWCVAYYLFSFYLFCLLFISFVIVLISSFVFNYKHIEFQIYLNPKCSCLPFLLNVNDGDIIISFH